MPTPGMITLFGCAAAGALVSTGFGAVSPASAADADHPVVIELFQSQACSSCPPANATLNAIADQPDVLALSFAVTYWDRLGWKDRFAQPAFTDRQWDYSRGGGRSNVSTPQMIVNGRGVLVGDRRDELLDVARRFDRGRSGPQLSVSPGQIIIGAAPTRRSGAVWLVSYDPRVRSVPIRAGENNGRTLPHRNIVVALRKVGTWSGKPTNIRITAAPRPLRSAILVQDGTGGAILAARRL